MGLIHTFRASYTGVLGKETQGVWPPNSDVTDVNAGAATSTVV